MINQFNNDNAYISTTWLLRLIRGRGLRVEHLLKITHQGTEAFHMLAILRGGQGYVCDCCMGMNAGLPCQHYFCALSDMTSMKFSIAFIRPRYDNSPLITFALKLNHNRWYQDNELNTENIPQVFAKEAPVNIRSQVVTNRPWTETHTLANPLQSPSPSRPSNAIGSTESSTQTIPARTVFHETNTLLKSMTAGIQTQEQLDDFMSDLNDLW